ncbi:hypothetical protein LshimejAT787_0405660 [Lyophyllum shimeji]|uniref:Uncharacterized protein n=1 Tax=Lyophyllum shimeji TaxID=47721 RepID=A0A9P3PJT1_LYOSH|nr:hypothetical protein LshimejAT787_0405660 [Lyophyllum shimeji]
MDVAACLWTHELQDFAVLRSWISHWQGPISLLMTTSAKPKSNPQAALFHRLNDLKAENLPGLSLHLLHVGIHEQASSNVYLNLARLFAPTAAVMLVPANLSYSPLVSHKAIVSERLSARQLPLIVTDNPQNWSTFTALPVLPPLVIQRNHPVWCTERYFLRKTRASDWRACLWQFWVDSFGAFVDVGTSNSSVRDSATASEVSNDRLSVRFRAETCDLVARTMATLGLRKYKDGKKKLQWLKETCGQLSVDKIFKYIER